MAGVEDLFKPAAPGGAQQLAYRQGTITAFNPVTLQNTVQVGGASFADLPLLGVAEADTLTAGSVVGLLWTGKEYAIIGRLVRPNTTDATDAINRLSNSILSASVTTGEDTTNTTYTDLATVGPVLQPTVKSSGRLIVLFSASIRGLDDVAGMRGGSMGVEVRDSSGSVLYNPASLPELSHIFTDNATHLLGDTVAATRILLLAGLTPGVYTLTAKYQAGASGNTATFAGRNLTTIAL